MNDKERQEFELAIKVQAFKCMTKGVKMLKGMEETEKVKLIQVMTHVVFGEDCDKVVDIVFKEVLDETLSILGGEENDKSSFN